jgi:hypothetical protein
LLVEGQRSGFPMRLRSEIFVKALLRTATAQGGFGTVLRRGSDEAGAVFIVILDKEGLADLYGPAPQSFFDDLDAGERIFEQLESGVDHSTLDNFQDKQERFDPDFWMVELETTRPVGDILRLSDDHLRT